MARPTKLSALRLKQPLTDGSDDSQYDVLNGELWQIS